MRDLKTLVRDAEPFPSSVVEQVAAGGGRQADYVPWYQYTQRLLAHHGAHRYEVTQINHGRQVTQTKDGPKETYVWAVAVRLYLSDDEWYDAVGEDDTPTSAESNAYKRACAHAGIGLHLYDRGYWLHGKLQRDWDAQEAGF